MGQSDVTESPDLDIDDCGLYRPQGFSTVALAQNDDIGRLCVIRKRDLRLDIYFLSCNKIKL